LNVFWIDVGVESDGKYVNNFWDKKTNWSL